MFSNSKNNNKYNEEYWIEQLDLKPHIEGGRFKEVYRTIEVDSQGVEKCNFTSIYYLLNGESKSHFHRLSCSDEVWYYHFGGTLTIHCIYPNGNYEKVLLGPNEGEKLQFNVVKNTIFSASYDKENNKNNNNNFNNESSFNYTLVGCMVCPGFQYQNFQFLKKSDLLHLYPQHSTLINRFAYDTIPTI
ncbi:hypothetical protein ACTFIU_000415 [Dictyostelium citrinum]